jgi:hypothetical protein
LIFGPRQDLGGEYCAPNFSAWALNFASSVLVHHSVSRPSPSDLRPWSSKPWVISWPITAPMPP